MTPCPRCDKMHRGPRAYCPRCLAAVAVRQARLEAVNHKALFAACYAGYRAGGRP